MPKAAMASGAAQHELPLDGMASFILESQVKIRNRKKSGKDAGFTV